MTFVVIEHGTYRGYQQHLRSGRAMCRDCRDAGSFYVFQWRARQAIEATAAILDERPDLRDLRAPVVRFVAGILEGA